MLNKKREQKAKLELSGKPDKGNQASVEVVEVSECGLTQLSGKGVYMNISINIQRLNVVVSLLSITVSCLYWLLFCKPDT
jgi:hypothetical protein